MMIPDHVERLETLFILELRVLMRNLFSGSGRRRRKPLILAAIVTADLSVTIWHFLHPQTVPDRRGIMTAGFLTALLIWNMLNALDSWKYTSHAYALSLAPIARTLYVHARLGAHWFCHTTVLLVLASPEFLNLALGGHPDVVLAIVILYIFAWPTTGFAWLLMSITVDRLGVKGSHFFVKIISFMFSLLSSSAILIYPDRLQTWFGLWFADTRTLIWSAVPLMIGEMIVFATAIYLSRRIMLQPSLVAGSGGGAACLRLQGFTAILAKEYRLLYRNVRKMIAFFLFHCLISFGLLWLMFRVLQNNELYYTVGSVMFAFGIYVAGPGNMLAVYEEQTWRMVWISPTSLVSVLCAKTVAVYSLMAPFSLAAGYAMLRPVLEDSLRMTATLGSGLGIAVMSVWGGIMETTLRLLGHGRTKITFLSFLILLNAFIIAVSTSFIRTIGENEYGLILAVASFIGCLVVGIGIRWVK